VYFALLAVYALGAQGREAERQAGYFLVIKRVTCSPGGCGCRCDRLAARTTSGFSEGTKQAARVRNAAPISLIDGDQLTDLLIERDTSG